MYTLYELHSLESMQLSMILEYPPRDISCVFLFFSVACVTGRFGVDCNQTCHCKHVTEDCQTTNGHCKSGCGQQFTGDTCEGNPL